MQKTIEMLWKTHDEQCGTRVTIERMENWPWHGVCCALILRLSVIWISCCSSSERTRFIYEILLRASQVVWFDPFSFFSFLFILRTYARGDICPCFLLLYVKCDIQKQDSKVIWLNDFFSPPLLFVACLVYFCWMSYPIWRIGSATSFYYLIFSCANTHHCV